MSFLYKINKIIFYFSITLLKRAVREKTVLQLCYIFVHLWVFVAISVHYCPFGFWDFIRYFCFEKQQIPVDKLYLPTRIFYVGDTRLERVASAV
ncbi:MAG: hypothetical protein DRQ01_09750 [Ignavibacteriae bacterium]|nr:MAG: hypothetical protein DRQ01_09750 [Ignavibacteriota bacterium]